MKIDHRNNDLAWPGWIESAASREDWKVVAVSEIDRTEADKTLNWVLMMLSGW